MPQKNGKRQCPVCKTLKPGPCDDHETVCHGAGQATTKGGVVQDIKHDAWWKLNDKDCTRCLAIQAAIQKKE